MEKLTIYSSDVFQNPTNCLYPHEIEGNRCRKFQESIQP